MDSFCCEECGVPLTQEMLVDAEGSEEMEEHDASNMPGACPECGAVQWDAGGY